jgi:hypothetical protein
MRPRMLRPRTLYSRTLHPCRYAPVHYNPNVTSPFIMFPCDTFLYDPSYVLYCARRDLCVHQRMNANGFLLPYDLFSWNNQGKTSDYIHTIVVTIYKQNNGRYFTILRTLCVMGSCCRIGPVLLSSWFPHGSTVSSTVADQLLILFLAGWARPPLRPPSQGDPLPSGSMHSPIPPSATFTAPYV